MMTNKRLRRVEDDGEDNDNDYEYNDRLAKYIKAYGCNPSVHWISFYKKYYYDRKRKANKVSYFIK